MDLEQAAKTIEWLDDQRRKDRKVLTVLEEQLSAVQETSGAVARRVEKLETDLGGLRAAVLDRLDKLEEVFPPLRDELVRLADAQTRQADASRENTRVVQVEQEGLSRALAEFRKSTDIVPRLMEEVAARKEEEFRLSRALNEVQVRVASALESIEEREQAVARFQESSRKESKRIADLQNELTDVRRRTDEHKGKLEVVDDRASRAEMRISELVAKENERRLAQSTWMEQQTVAQAERERDWKDMLEKVGSFKTQAAEWAENMKVYHETHREMQKTLDTFYENLDRIERRISEAVEVQRLAEERFRQDWNAFLADDQKKWTTHMLLRDEQWRENERKFAKALERLTTLEADMADVEEAFRDKNFSEQARLQALFNWVREALAEYDETLTRVR